MPTLCHNLKMFYSRLTPPKTILLPQISLYEITACACLEQVASLRSARQAHADATELDSLYSENESASKGDAAATPLAVMRPFFDLRFFIFKPCITLIFIQFTFRSLLIVSAETSPIYSPSFQQEKSSKSSNFLSSIPIGAATSLSIISDMKNCGSPFEYTSFSPVFSRYLIIYCIISPRSSFELIATKSLLPKRELKSMF